jgi:hypothetical protein
MIEGEAVYELYAGPAQVDSIPNHFQVSVRDGEWGINTWVVGSSNRLECYRDAELGVYYRRW